eukprot:scaffold11593_cov61-Phaeocystis_antarctica.AAC.1
MLHQILQPEAQHRHIVRPHLGHARARHQAVELVHAVGVDAVEPAPIHVERNRPRLPLRLAPQRRGGAAEPPVSPARLLIAHALPLRLPSAGLTAISVQLEAHRPLRLPLLGGCTGRYIINAPEGYPHGTHTQVGRPIHTRHLLESTHTNTHK